MKEQGKAMYTLDGVLITHGLHVWDYNLDVGTVDLSRTEWMNDGWFDVQLAKGGKSLMDATRVWVREPHGQRRKAADVYEQVRQAEEDAWEARTERGNR